MVLNRIDKEKKNLRSKSVYYNYKGSSSKKKNSCFSTVNIDVSLTTILFHKCYVKNTLYANFTYF